MVNLLSRAQLALSIRPLEFYKTNHAVGEDQLVMPIPRPRTIQLAVLPAALLRLSNESLLDLRLQLRLLRRTLPLVNIPPGLVRIDRVHHCSS